MNTNYRLIERERITLDEKLTLLIANFADKTNKTKIPAADKYR